MNFTTTATKKLSVFETYSTHHDNMVTQKAKTDLMTLAIFDGRVQSLTRCYAAIFYLDDDETWFPGSCIIVHHKYKIINLCSKLSLCTSGLNGNGRLKIESGFCFLGHICIFYLLIMFVILMCTFITKSKVVIFFVLQYPFSCQRNPNSTFFYILFSLIFCQWLCTLLPLIIYDLRIF